MGATATVSGATLVNGYFQGDAIEAQGRYAQRSADANAHLLDLRAQDEITRGDQDAVQFKKKIRKLQGVQRVGFAAGGADVNTGNALEAQQQTAEHGAMDALTIKNNAFKRAWGLQVEATNERFAGQYARIAASGNAAKTYAAAGLDAFKYAYPELKKSSGSTNTNGTYEDAFNSRGAA